MPNVARDAPENVSAGSLLGTCQTCTVVWLWTRITLAMGDFGHFGVLLLADNCDLRQFNEQNARRKTDCKKNKQTENGNDHRPEYLLNSFGVVVLSVFKENGRQTETPLALSNPWLLFKTKKREITLSRLHPTEMQVFQVCLHFVHSSWSLQRRKPIRHGDVPQRRAAHCIYTPSRRRRRRVFKIIDFLPEWFLSCPDWRSCQASKTKRPRASLRKQRGFTLSGTLVERAASGPVGTRALDFSRACWRWRSRRGGRRVYSRYLKYIWRQECHHEVVGLRSVQLLPPIVGFRCQL